MLSTFTEKKLRGRKTLQKGAFSWPALEGDALSVHLKPEELAMLLGGIELERTRFKNWWRRCA